MKSGVYCTFFTGRVSVSRLGLAVSRICVVRYGRFVDGVLFLLGPVGLVHFFQEAGVVPPVLEVKEQPYYEHDYYSRDYDSAGYS